MSINESIEYLGEPGITDSCLDALRRLIQYGAPIRSARLISSRNSHAVLLLIDEGDVAIVRAGFTSGYPGGGPAGLAQAIQLLRHQGIELDEVDVDSPCMERLNTCSLREADLEHIRSGRPVRPSQIYGYLMRLIPKGDTGCGVYRHFPVVMPYRILDERLLDLALKFRQDPDAAVLSAFRRLEDVVRQRSGVDEHGGKLFSRAFGGPQAPLKWPDVVNENETVGRVQLFTGTYMAYRNPQAHAERESHQNAEAMLIPFLAVNHLFVLERQAMLAPARDSGPSVSSVVTSGS